MGTVSESFVPTREVPVPIDETVPVIGSLFHGNNEWPVGLLDSSGQRVVFSLISGLARPRADSQ